MLFENPMEKLMTTHNMTIAHLSFAQVS